MSVICPHCQAPAHYADSFCRHCGLQLKEPIPGDDEDFIPIPGVVGRPDLRTVKRRRRRRWYRKPLPLALALLALIVLVGSVSAMFYIQRSFGEINELSTPPPIVSGSVFGPGTSRDVDTAPAQQAIEAAQSGGLSVRGSSAGPALPDSPSTDDATAQATAAAAGTPASGTRARKPVRESDGSAMNILLMQVDVQEGDTIDAGVRPDTLAVLHLDGESGTCRVLKIPTDARTELPGYGESRVNHALAVGGIPYQRLVVEQMLGIEIDHYGLFDFSGMEGLVDAVDGVTIDNPEAFRAGEERFAEGKITLDGQESLSYARGEGGEEDAAARQKRQNRILRALLGKASGMNVVRTAPGLLRGVEGHFRTDLTPAQMITLANSYRTSCTSEKLESAGIEGKTATHRDPLLNRDLTYLILEPRDLDRKVEWLLEGP